MPLTLTLHTNRRPALGFGLGHGLFSTGRPHHVIVGAAVGELVRRRSRRLSSRVLIGCGKRSP